MKKILIFLMILPMVLTGCFDQKIFEQIGFILNVGIESSKDDNLLVTYTSPVVHPGAGPTDIELIVSTGSILREARGGARRRSSRLLEAGKVQQVLISAELARKRNVHELIEVLERDPIDPTQAWVIIVDGSPNEMLKVSIKYKDKPRPAVYINQLMLDSAKSSYTPRTQVYDFDINYFAPGVDPMTPLVGFTEKEIRVTGSALFSEGLMVGSIDHFQTFFLLVMMGDAGRTDFSSVYPNPPGTPGKKDNMVVTLKDNSRKINVAVEDDKPVIKISLAFGGYVYEYAWDNLGDDKEQKKIEKHLEGLIKKDCEEVLKYLTRVGSDPIGIGDMVRAKFNSYWKSTEWKQAYRDAVFYVDVDLDIKQYGSID